MNRIISKVAVLGSGIMGSRIACHFANIGCEVLLLDMKPKELSEKDKSMGLTEDSRVFRNSIVDSHLANTLKSNPSPIYSKKFISRISTGNFEDDMSRISNCDWIIEVVVERLDIKKIIFDQVEKYRKEGSIVSSNTSGIPIHLMLDGRSEDFQSHFCGTHFFNPPRYLQLLEIIPTQKTKSDVVNFLMDFGSKFLGKKTVLCKDTPAFIANRVGVYSIMSLFHLVEEMNLTVEEVDKLTGPVLGRPKSATFRTCDVVGLDTLVHVANGLKSSCLTDEEVEVFNLPKYVSSMVENNWLGSKSNQGFYKKDKKSGQKPEILTLDLVSLEYRSAIKPKFTSLDQAKSIENLADRTKFLFSSKDKSGEFYRKHFGGIFAYVANRIPEISDETYKIDDAIKAGFGWELGPFETWDILGFEKGIQIIEEAGKNLPSWVNDLRKTENFSFYKKEEGKKLFYNQLSGKYEVIPGTENLLILDSIREKNTVWKNADTTIVDLGDGILNIEFHTKMNSIGGGVVAGIHKAIDLVEKEYKGLVIYNTGQNFSAGANVGMIFMMAIEQEYDELNFAIKAFQDVMMRIRYSNIPVVVAPHNMALGGSCEMSMHADKVVAHSELYMGLVEFGVGLIPGGGGTKEFAKRLSDELKEGDIKINRFKDKFLTIGQAKVSTSAEEAFELGYLRRGVDEIVVSRDHQLLRAKEACLTLSENGYVAPKRLKNITVLGKEALGIVYVGAHSMFSGNYMSEHDKVISEKLGLVLAGGDLSENTLVSEQYILDLERKAFLELCMEKKTLLRLESILKFGKILRN
jgi:3-hydroxyacyl-CoA dehydrogenase